MTLDDIRALFEYRWEKLGDSSLLPRERDFIVLTWLKAEMLNGTLHEYVLSPSINRNADWIRSRRGLDHDNVVRVLAESVSMCSVATSLDDGLAPDDLRAEIEREPERFEILTERIFNGSSDVMALALNRIAEEYTEHGINADKPIPATNRKRALVLLVGVAILVFIGVAAWLVR